MDLTVGLMAIRFGPVLLVLVLKGLCSCSQRKAGAANLRVLSYFEHSLSPCVVPIQCTGRGSYGKLGVVIAV